MVPASGSRSFYQVTSGQECIGRCILLRCLLLPLFQNTKRVKQASSRALASLFFHNGSRALDLAKRGLLCTMCVFNTLYLIHIKHSGASFGRSPCHSDLWLPCRRSLPTFRELLFHLRCAAISCSKVMLDLHSPEHTLSAFIIASSGNTGTMEE